MPFNNNENKTRKSRSRAMNLVVAGAVAAAPVVGCGTTKPNADAASNVDATGAVDKAETGAEHPAADALQPDSGAQDVAASDALAAVDAAKDAGGDDAVDAYPDGVRG